jgi:hypothetical protein
MSFALVGALLSYGYTAHGGFDIQLREMIDNGDLDRVPDSTKNEVIDAFK